MKDTNILLFDTAYLECSGVRTDHTGLGGLAGRDCTIPYREPFCPGAWACMLSLVFKVREDCLRDPALAMRSTVSARALPFAEGYEGSGCDVFCPSRSTSQARLPGSESLSPCGAACRPVTLAPFPDQGSTAKREGGLRDASRAEWCPEPTLVPTALRIPFPPSMRRTVTPAVGYR